jgi:hypothetical protein
MWRYLSRTSKSIWLLFASAALAMSASGVAAQSSRPLFEWNGRVDREVQLTMRGRDVWTRSFGQQDGRLPGPDISAALPRDEGIVRVRLESGQGEVRVIQQPSAENDYTAIVRVRDLSNSGEMNRITATWLPYASSGGEVVTREDYAVPRGRYPGEQLALHWTGRVDDGLEIRMRGDRVSYRTLSGEGPREIDANVLNYGIPMDDLNVRVHQLNGRGTVTVVQQPDEENNYTAIIRIYDPQPRFGFYDFDLTVRR